MNKSKSMKFGGQVFKYLLALLCFGMLGAKIASAQTTWSGSNAPHYGANFMIQARPSAAFGAFTYEADLNHMYPSEVNSHYYDGPNYGPNESSSIFSYSDYSWYKKASEDTSPLNWDTAAVQNTGFKFDVYYNADATGLHLSSVALVNASLDYEVFVNGVSYGNGVTINQDYTQTVSPTMFNEAACIEIVPFDPAGTLSTNLLFTFDDLVVDGYTVDQFNIPHNLYTGATPEPSSSLLMAVGFTGLLMRRKRA